ncbi:hypothetical protein AAZX31_04G032200 [Glycine max]|uniref:Uncharacterized protein n=2 Tax=Glycine subgen. Soja TaxID=1462606 RepID=I1JTC1_SOYBN|nr:uncharacterized protein LOC114408648 isoform X2 [Glycine soja]KAG5048088.1 hypothetical protein JHK85_009191 [Glycine max]KAG5033890.1 hypothetical protein JHK87_008800 [Glycine soja]KAG5065211.1 hypothetical protein JHK86_008942 [Glycine max]KAH1109556.1 hypothetical protein GYH30_008792 [Glycine max]KAH1252379.1 hypothetical protein GmHk_04G009364 [Glycine max]
MRKRGSHEYDGDSGNTNSKRHLLLWILAAVILIALWSMFAGSVTLKWSLSNNDDLDSTILEDLDVLEVEEREKVVRHMWDLYSHTNTKSVGLPKFWWEAFEAAYQQLVSDVPAVRDAAVSEIAKMSLRSLPIQIQSHSSITASRKIKQAKSRTGQ